MSRLRCVELAGDRECLGPSVVVEADGQPRCLTHARDLSRVHRREARNLRGGLGRLRTLPPGTKRPDFSTGDKILRFAEELARLVLIGRLDPRLSAEARNLASVAIALRSADAQERIAEALARVEHGGAAVMLLQRLQAGIADGPRRPLPGRTPRALEGEPA